MPYWILVCSSGKMVYSEPNRAEIKRFDTVMIHVKVFSDDISELQRIALCHYTHIWETDVEDAVERSYPRRLPRYARFAVIRLRSIYLGMVNAELQITEKCLFLVSKYSTNDRLFPFSRSSQRLGTECVSTTWTITKSRMLFTTVRTSWMSWRRLVSLRRLPLHRMPSLEHRTWERLWKVPFMSRYALSTFHLLYFC